MTHRPCMGVLESAVSLAHKSAIAVTPETDRVICRRRFFNPPAMTRSFLFYDLETFGADPRRTRIAQFAAIRTDLDLNEIEEPAQFFVRPANDLLPSPEATLVTKITPQYALQHGICEQEAIARMHDLMSAPGTCTLGYNSLRFDDEFIRYGLYRHFYDPYEREWRGGNSRWDLLDVMRLVHALRPDGIEWSAREDGQGTSFKLEHLASANGVRIGDAHEALSDVRALIGIARKVRSAQPKLWDYALKLRDKRHAASLLDVIHIRPVLHVSQRYPASSLCAAVVAPLAVHPHINTRVIVFDLSADPQQLFDLDAETIASRLYLRRDELPEGQERIALKEVHTNRCPALVEFRHLRSTDFARLKIDPALIETRAAHLRAHAPELAEKLRKVYAINRNLPAAVDADAALYDGFFGDGDKRQFAAIRRTAPAELGTRGFSFNDPRLPELLFRYRARNWPETLNLDERQRWDEYRRRRLMDDTAGLSELSLPQYQAQIAALRAQHAGHPETLTLLDALDEWGDQFRVILPP